MSAQKFSQLYRKLNPEQKKAVDTIEGPVMVIAGPGTGKTQILTLRVANILGKTDTPPDAILALTFTESATFTMRRRLVDIVGAPGYRVRIHTFHGFANEVIGRFPDSFPRIVGSRAMTDVERMSLIQRLVAEADLEFLKPFGDPYFYVPSLSQKIGELKRENISPEKFKELLDLRLRNFQSIDDLYHEKGAHKGAMKGKYAQQQKKLDRDGELLQLYRRYEEELATLHLYDYEDMLLEVIRAFERDADLLLTLQEECQYVLADEHQDANESQNRLLELLASFHGEPNLFVVGDEKQAIFRFQGASLDNFLFFKRRYPNATVIALRENYRSTQRILDGAHELMTHAPAHAEIPRIPLLARGNGTGGKIQVVSLPKPDDECAFVAEEATRLIKEGVAPRDIAVLFRTNRDSQPIAAALARKRVPYVIESDQNVLGDTVVRKFVALLTAVAEYGSDIALAPALHVDFIGLPPLSVARFLSKARGDLYLALVDKKKLLAYKIERPIAFVNFAKKLERWKRVAENDGLLEALDSIAEESGLIASLLQSQHPEEKLAAINALFREARSLKTSNRDASLADFLAHLELLEEYRLSLSLPRSQSERGGVRLMTAHRAKGLEFEHVYVIFANDGHWGNRTVRDFFSPVIARPTPAVDEDEQSDERRLFYVALTRAKVALTITLARESESGTPALPSQFVEELGPDLTTTEEKGEMVPAFNPGRTPVRHALDRTLVQELFAEQGLSVTALNNYLSCPWRYFYRNLVRLPEAHEKGLEYGTAMHRALHDFFERWKEGEDPGADGLVERFRRALLEASMSVAEYAESQKKGEKSLRAYYAQWSKVWGRSIVNEYKLTVFLPTDIDRLPRLRLRGDLDKMEFLDDGVAVTDYKTGKRKTRAAIAGKEKVEEWGDYKRQLVFYKLLLDLFEGGKWHVRAAAIEFIEPDEKGKIWREAFEPTNEEAHELRALINRVAKEIWTLAFVERRCDDKKCRYCALREFTVPTLSSRKSPKRPASAKARRR